MTSDKLEAILEQLKRALKYPEHEDQPVVCKIWPKPNSDGKHRYEIRN